MTQLRLRRLAAHVCHGAARPAATAEAARPDVFAEECLINFTAWCLDLRLYLVRNKTEVYVRHGRGGAAGGPPPRGVAVLTWIDANHFEPILPPDVFHPYVAPEGPLAGKVRSGAKCCVLPAHDPIFQTPFFQNALG